MLLVDDSEATRFSLRLLFEELGFIVESAKSGSAALELAQKNHFDLASFDIIMEEMDGIECSRKIKGIDPSCECLFISILARDERVTSWYNEEMGAVRFIPKPTSIEEVRNRLLKIMPLLTTQTPAQ